MARTVNAAGDATEAQAKVVRDALSNYHMMQGRLSLPDEDLLIFGTYPTGKPSPWPGADLYLLTKKSDFDNRTRIVKANAMTYTVGIYESRRLVAVLMESQIPTYVP